MRPARARTAVKQAYLAFLATKPSGDITVTELAREARINRITFYRLYAQLDDVLEDILSEFDDQVAQHIAQLDNDYESNIAVVRAILELHKQQMPMLRTILKSDKAYVLEHRIAEGTRGQFLEANAMHDYPHGLASMTLSFYVAGIARVVCDWLLGGCRESIDELIAFFTMTANAYIA